MTGAATVILAMGSGEGSGESHRRSDPPGGKVTGRSGGPTQSACTGQRRADGASGEARLNISIYGSPGLAGSFDRRRRARCRPWPTEPVRGLSRLRKSTLPAGLFRGTGCIGIMGSVAQKRAIRCANESLPAFRRLLPATGMTGPFGSTDTVGGRIYHKTAILPEGQYGGSSFSGFNAGSRSAALSNGR